MKFNTSLLISMLGLPLFLLTQLTGCNSGEGNLQNTSETLIRPAKIVFAQPAGIVAVRSYPGSLEASRKTELAFRVGGELEALPARAGMRVKKGELLAQLDDEEYKKDFDEARARQELAEIQFKQYKKLLEQKLASRLQFDQANAELKSATAALERARNNVAYTKLLAPFDGAIAQVSVENYQAVSANTPIIQFHSQKTLDVRVSIPESMISRLLPDSNSIPIDQFCGKVYFQSHPGKAYQACHKEHEFIPDPVTRNYSAVFTLQPLSDFVALPGMTVKLVLDFSPFMASQSPEAVLIPVESIFYDDGGQWVWAVGKDMKVHRTAVDIDQVQGEMIRVSHGIMQDQPIVAAGVSYLREGIKVRPMRKERGL
jgi:RND family efflux transporter MFP subunit